MVDRVIFRCTSFPDPRTYEMRVQGLVLAEEFAAAPIERLYQRRVRENIARRRLARRLRERRSR